MSSADGGGGTGKATDSAEPAAGAAEPAVQPEVTAADWTEAATSVVSAESTSCHCDTGARTVGALSESSPADSPAKSSTGSSAFCSSPESSASTASSAAS